jgi:CubicO group peptidase (beta-lactamase class C family)
MRRLIAALLLLSAAAVVPIVADDRSPAAMMARIEGVQSPNRQGLDPLTLQQLMDRFHVPGVSVAIIHDFEIHWTKGYGVDQQGGRRDGRGPGGRGWNVLAGRRHHYDSEVVEAAGRRVHAPPAGYATRAGPRFARCC